LCTVLTLAVLAFGLTAAVVEAQQKQVPAPRSGISKIDPGSDARTGTKPPFLFEENLGQADKRAAFVVRRSGYNVFLTKTGFVTVLRGIPPTVAASGPKTIEQHDAMPPEKSMALHMQFVSAQGSVTVSGEKSTGTRTSYFIGNDPAKWIRNVPMHAAVKYTGLYRDTDMYAESDGGRLRYHFVVGPKGKPERIRMRFTGIKAADIDAEGRLILTLPNGLTVVHHPPRAFEYSKTEEHQIEAAFELITQDTVAFKLPKRRPGTTLLIDPEIDFATYFGGTGNDSHTAGLHFVNQFQTPLLDLDTDAQDRILVGGTTYSTDLPNAAGPVTPGFSASFAARLDPNASGGAAWDYVSYVGGSLEDDGFGITAGPNGSAFLCGRTNSSDFPLSDTPFDRRIVGGLLSGFLVRLDGSGAFTAGTAVHPGDHTVVTACEYHHTLSQGRFGSVYASGFTSNQQTTALFPQYVQAGAAQNKLASTAHPDAFVMAIDHKLETLKYFTLLGGKFEDTATDIAVRNGEAFITGVTESHDFPYTEEAADDHEIGPIDGEQCGDRFESYRCFDSYAARLNADGTAFLYATGFGDDGIDGGFAIDVDPTGSAYVSGLTEYGSNGSSAYVVKVRPAGNALAYQTYFGSIDSVAYDVKADRHGNAYITGEIRDTSQAVGNALSIHHQGGERDGFFAILDIAGNPAYLTYLGGEALDLGLAMTMDRNFCAYIGLETWSDTLNVPLTGAPQGTRAGASDVLLIRHCQPPNYEGLVIEKSVPPLFVDPGQTTQFRITIENNDLFIPGPVTVTDKLPLPFQPVSVAGENCTISGRTVSCTLAAIDTGVHGIVIDALNRFEDCTAIEADPTERINTATVAFPDGSERKVSASAFYRGCLIEKPPSPIDEGGMCNSTDDCSDGLVCFEECVDTFSCVIRIGPICIGRNEFFFRRPPVCARDPVVNGCSKILD
jgi:hypothetical protein